MVARLEATNLNVHQVKKNNLVLIVETMAAPKLQPVPDPLAS
jgi:hypothetical protein